MTTGFFETGFSFVAGASPALLSKAVWAAVPFLKVWPVTGFGIFGERCSSLQT